ncbi:MAG: 2-amino-4-hydroxy-6-hydroxymethyldihydropteridine diphosphokinase [Pseudomonadota bacterium]
MTEKPARVYIAVGSNMGSSYDNCIQGIDRLNGLDGTRVVQRSKFYRTAPMDYLDQDWFINGAVEIETTLEPLELIRGLKMLERSMGQFEKSVRFGPRVIDLDILLFEDRVIDTRDLIIPHPRMQNRSFVLKPLCDIGADVRHPVLGLTIRQLMEHIENDPDQTVLEYSPGGPN